MAALDPGTSNLTIAETATEVSYKLVYNPN